MTGAQRTLGVGVIGAGWLGDVHARAWGRLRHHYADLGVTPQFVAVADSVPGRAMLRSPSTGSPRHTAIGAS